MNADEPIEGAVKAGSTWAKAGKGNRREKNPKIREQAAREVTKLLAVRAARNEGKRREAGADAGRLARRARKTFECPECHAQVVDDARGREGHAQRMPKCRVAVGRGGDAMK